MRAKLQAPRNSKAAVFAGAAHAEQYSDVWKRRDFLVKYVLRRYDAGFVKHGILMTESVGALLKASALKQKYATEELHEKSFACLYPAMDAV